MLTLNYTYRIYPDLEQQVLLDEWLETCRLSYNYALRERMSLACRTSKPVAQRS
ncbi:helix-turn-helix domain-containing protein [Gloeocapsopsis dulcis]|nr:helix-turn-helix domain-containing protein [Gloeocapsopsis dulcis]